MNQKLPGFLQNKLEGFEPEEKTLPYILALIPYEETTTYKKGTALGPEAMVDASGHMELYDEELGIDASTHGVLTLRPEIIDLQSITGAAAEIQHNYPRSLCGFLGGEHSITPAIIEGMAVGEFGIVWIDAHADLRKTYIGRPDNHACAAYNCLKFGKIAQVGIRSLAKEEARLIEVTPEVTCVREWGEAAREAIQSLPERVYLSVDVDGLDPQLMRSVGTPEPGGLSWKEMMEILDFVFQEKKVFAFDVVELCPFPDDVVSVFTAAKLVYKILTYHACHSR